jgi:hypothetical protein
VSEARTVKARWPVCGRCNHPGPLHSHEGEPGPCAAKGCHGGPDNEPCPGFISAGDWAVRQDLSAAIDEAQAQAQADPRMASEAMQARAAELRERIEAELTAERRTMLVRAAAGAALVLAVAVLIRAVRRRDRS